MCWLFAFLKLRLFMKLSTLFFPSGYFWMLSMDHFLRFCMLHSQIEFNLVYSVSSINVGFFIISNFAFFMRSFQFGVFSCWVNRPLGMFCWSNNIMNNRSSLIDTSHVRCWKSQSQRVEDHSCVYGFIFLTFWIRPMFINSMLELFIWYDIVWL